jgi:hypothetical protein
MISALRARTYAAHRQRAPLNAMASRIQGRRDWVRLHEKGGKLHTLPCHDNLDRYLEEFVAAAGLAKDAKGPLFRTVRDRTAYLKNGGMLETAQQMTAHESPRTTGLYDRRSDDVSLEEVEKITI